MLCNKKTTVIENMHLGIWGNYLYFMSAIYYTYRQNETKNFLFESQPEEVYLRHAGHWKIGSVQWFDRFLTSSPL